MQRKAVTGVCVALTPAPHGRFFNALRCDPSRCVHAYAWTHRDGSQRNARNTHPCGAGLSSTRITTELGQMCCIWSPLY